MAVIIPIESSRIRYYALCVSVSGGSTPKAVEVIEGEPGGNKDEVSGDGPFPVTIL